MGNEILALIGGIGRGMQVASRQNQERQYKDALIGHIKTQAKLDQQKLELMAMQGQLEQQKNEQLNKVLQWGMSPEGTPAPDMTIPPRKAYPGMDIPGGMAQPEAPQQPSGSGLIGLIQRLIQGGKPQQQQPQSMGPGLQQPQQMIQPQSMQTPGGGYGPIQRLLGGGVINQGSAQNMAQPTAINAPPAILPLIQQAAQTHGLPPELIASVIKAESNFNPQAVSPAGAQGLMQLMPATAQGLGVDPMNPAQNIAGGARFLKAMLQKYNNNLPMALAAYNWGPGNVDKFGLENMPGETKNYIATVMGGLRQGQQPQGLIPPIAGSPSSGFTASRGDRQHNGYDFPAPAGSTFVAPANLQITATRDQMSNSPGGMVWGVDKNGIEHRFHHVVPGVKPGDTVPAGQPLGTLAEINGPHLDYKQYDTKSGNFVDYGGQGGFAKSAAGQQYAQAGGTTATDQSQAPTGQFQTGGQGQMQVPRGPQTGVGGKPMLSKREAFVFALQSLTGGKIPDRKTPIHVTTGTDILLLDPEDPRVILNQIPIPTDITPIKRTDDQGRTWDEFWQISKKEGVEPRLIGKIQTGPGAGQQGALKAISENAQTESTDFAAKGKGEGIQENAKKLTTGENTTEASVLGLAKSGLEVLQSVKSKLINPDGSVNKQMIPFATSLPEDSTLRATMLYKHPYRELEAEIKVAIQSARLMATGKVMNEKELVEEVKKYAPIQGDSDQTIKTKIKLLETVLTNSIKIADPTGAKTGWPKMIQGQTESPTQGKSAQGNQGLTLEEYKKMKGIK